MASETEGTQLSCSARLGTGWVQGVGPARTGYPDLGPPAQLALSKGASGSQPKGTLATTVEEAQAGPAQYLGTSTRQPAGECGVWRCGAAGRTCSQLNTLVLSYRGPLTNVP